MFQLDLFASQSFDRDGLPGSGSTPRIIGRPPSARALATECGTKVEVRQLGLPEVLERLATVSARPRYTFMVLNLIARAAGQTNSAGPYVKEMGHPVAIRDWLSDALVPMAQRDPRRLATEKRIREELAGRGSLPAEAALADDMVAAELRIRLRHSGRTNVSRAVSDLVRAGLVQRHYQGYCVDHENRGAQREAVYTIGPAVRRALGKGI